MTEAPFEQEMFPYILQVHLVHGMAEGVNIYCRSKKEAEEIRLQLLDKSPKGLESIYLYTHAEIWGETE